MTFSASPALMHRRNAALGSVPIVTIGLLVVTFALRKMPWPPDQPPATRYGVTVTYSDRLQGEQVNLPQQADQGTLWYLRRGLDGLALLALVISYLAVALLFWFDEALLLLVLSVTGAYGVLYGAVVGLHPGPILTVIGFGLILTGAGLNWLSRIVSEQSAHGGAAPAMKSRTGNDEL